MLDFTRIISGPYMTMMLGELGADVIKIESPAGDDMRALQPPGRGGEAASFIGLNRSKRSIVLDLMKSEARDLVRRLVPTVDVLVENFRPGTMQKLELDETSLRPLNPRLVYCSISGYGAHGAFSALGGYDPIAQAEAGLMYLTGDPTLPPARAGGSVADVLTGLHAGLGVLAALCGVSRAGDGEAVNVSLFGSTLSSIGYILQGTLLGGEDPPRTGNMSLFSCPNGLYHCADGDIMMTVGNDRMFVRLCQDALEDGGLADDTRFRTNADRMANAASLNAILDGRLGSDTRTNWVARLRRAGIPAGSVRKPTEAVTSDEAREGGLIAEMVHPSAGTIPVIRSPIHLKASAHLSPTSSPLLGEHTGEVLRDLLGMTDAELAALAAVGAIVGDYGEQ